MYKRWENDQTGYVLVLIKSKMQSRVILSSGTQTLMVKHYEWEQDRTAEREAEALATLGKMTVKEESSWVYDTQPSVMS